MSLLECPSHLIWGGGKSTLTTLLVSKESKAFHCINSPSFNWLFFSPSHSTVVLHLLLSFTVIFVVIARLKLL